MTLQEIYTTLHGWHQETIDTGFDETVPEAIRFEFLCILRRVLEAKYRVADYID